MWLFGQPLIANAPTTELLPDRVVMLGNTLKAISVPVWNDKIGYILASKIVIDDVIYQIVQCESSWNNSARGKAGEIGLAQFLPQTFYWMSSLAGFQGSIYNEQDQLKLLKWALENNLSSHWVCSKGRIIKI